MAAGEQTPTVTDADLALGRIDPHAFAGGTLRLDVGAAGCRARRIGRQPLETRIAVARRGRVGNRRREHDERARVHAIERGKVISRYAMIAFGGGAPLHAGPPGREARRIDSRRAVGASVGSAIGFLRAPVAFEVVRSLRVALSRFDPAQVNELLRASATRATEVVRKACRTGALSIRRAVDARYIGQGHETDARASGKRSRRGRRFRVCARSSSSSTRPCTE
jgi:N-methylhydantoinase A